MKRRELKLIRLETLIWLVLFCLLVFYILEQGEPLSEALDHASHSIASYVIIVYGNALWLMPRLYRKKKYLLYTLSIIILIVALTFLRVQSQAYIYFALIKKKPYHLVFSNYVYTFVIYTLFFFFSIAFRFTLDFFRIKQQQEELLKQHAQAQLSLLKAQVQPHFLFNTLNNIYFVAQRESPHTAELLEKLSNIMRYFLEQGSKDKIPLAAELDFIKNYIELEKMRIRYPVRINIDITGEPDNIKIPPMLLIPIVENVFKHGIDKSKENNYIDITTHIADHLYFEVCNSTRVNGVAFSNNGNGTGLKNLTDRLNILYPGNFKFESSKIGDQYVSKLNIPL